MIVDLCLGGSWDESPMPSPAPHNRTSSPVLPDVHTCRGTARLPPNSRVLNTSRVLQVGGLVHPLPALTLEGKAAPSQPPHFRGCIRNLRVNGVVSLKISSYSVVHLIKSLKLCQNSGCSAPSFTLEAVMMAFFFFAWLYFKDGW